MGWIPERAWLTKIRVDGAASDITFDLAVAADGGTPSAVDAGFAPVGPTPAPWSTPRTWGLLALAVSLPLLAVWLAIWLSQRRSTPPLADA
jgi:hypothetical protein